MKLLCEYGKGDRVKYHGNSKISDDTGTVVRYEWERDFLHVRWDSTGEELWVQDPRSISPIPPYVMIKFNSDNDSIDAAILLLVKNGYTVTKCQN